MRLEGNEGCLYMMGNNIIKTYLELCYNRQTKCCLDMYLPSLRGFKTIVYFHGGGLEAGDKADKNYVEIAKRFAECGYGFVSVNYRMYPTAKFPEYLEDAAEAIAWVKTHIQEYDGNGELYVSGQSAGAWISLMLCLNKEYLNAVGISPMEIKGWIIDSAQTTSHFNVLKRETGSDPSLQRIDKYAPLYYVDKDTRLTKMLILFYEEDMPCRPEQNMLFIKALKNFNENTDIQYKQLLGGHCCGSTVKDDDGEYAFVKETLRWLEKC